MEYIMCAKVVDAQVIDIAMCINVAILGGDWLPVPLGMDVGMGWTWDGERFSPPEETE